MTGHGETAVDAPPAARRGRVVLAIVAAAVLVTALAVAFRWGASGRPAELADARPSASASPGAPSVAQIYTAVAPSVVSISAPRGVGAASGGAAGTGVIANADGLILTALHVVQGAAAIEVTYFDGTRSAAKVVSSSPAIDIAVLAAASLPSVVVPAVLGGGLSVGDQVVAIGNQLALAGSTTAGVVSGLDRSAGELTGLIQFDAAVNPGSSGGPLVNARGQTVGIVVALANPTDAGTFIGIGFAVPIGAALGAGGSPVPQI